MFFCIICFRDPSHPSLVNIETQDAQQNWQGLKGRLALSGVFLSEDRKYEIGGLYICRADSRSDVEAIMEDHPQLQTGIIQRYEVHPWATSHIV